MENGESPPFWVPHATVARRQRRRRWLRFLHPSLLIILLPCLCVLLLVFMLVPTIPKFVPQNLRDPNTSQHGNSTPTPKPKHISIKLSWQSVNVVLVVFAILCGVFAKRNDDVLGSEVQHHHHYRPIHFHDHQGRINGGDLQRSKLGGVFNAGPQQWVGYSEQRIYSTVPPVTGISRLRRTVSELPPAQVVTGNDWLRFFDDFDVNRFYYPGMMPSHVIHQHQGDVIPETQPENEATVKEIPVVLQTRGELPSPDISRPPTPPPPPKVPSNKKPKRSFQSVPSREEPPPPTPTPPPPPPPSHTGWGQKKTPSSLKRINATKEIANAIASLYSSRKRKRKQKRKQNNEENWVNETAQPQHPPPPPPPPSPPSVTIFQSLFGKGTKRKKIHSLSSIPVPPPPPPPPPPPCQKPANSAVKPPLLTGRGSQSPLIPKPPPPPPAFTAADDVVSNSGPGTTSAEGNVTCPSPDVNSKADTFIARHHDGWRLEKLNSWREKHNCGPRPSF